jgi:hypothetical protein
VIPILNRLFNAHRIWLVKTGSPAAFAMSWMSFPPRSSLTKLRNKSSGVVPSAFLACASPNDTSAVWRQSYYIQGSCIAWQSNGTNAIQR